MAGINDMFSTVRSATLVNVTGTCAAAGSNAIVAAPGAGYTLIVSSFVVQNEAATANTIRLMAGATAHWRCFAQNQGDGLAMIFAEGREWVLGENLPLNIDLAAATTCGYSIRYWSQQI